MKIQSIISVPFTGLGLYGGYRGDNWFKHRAGIFSDYTLKSLINQKDKDFFLWIQFRPEERENPITEGIIEALNKSGIKYAITYHGITMYDDRGTEHNIDLIERTNESITEIKDFIDGDYIYETILGSDDMLRNDFIGTVKSKPFKERGALYMKNGFVYNTNDIIAEWFNPSSVGSYTIMYPIDVYLEAAKKYEYQNGLKTHEEIPYLFNAGQLPDGMYCATIHGFNISTIWNHPYKGPEYYYEEEKNKIKQCFGIKN